MTECRAPRLPGAAALRASSLTAPWGLLLWRGPDGVYVVVDKSINRVSWAMVGGSGVVGVGPMGMVGPVGSGSG